MAFLIIGHVEPTKARIWVRGVKASKEARLRYRKQGGQAWKTESAELSDFRGFIEVITLEGLEPDTSYECELSYKAGKAPPVNRGAFRTAPAAARDIAFLLGSCNWSRIGGGAKASWEGILGLSEALPVDFMIHCGDQVYADLPGTLAEFMDLRYYRDLYQKAWNLKATAEMLARLPHYMMLDDHEIFDNYYVGKPYTWESSERIRDSAQRAYTEYQHSHNPQMAWNGFHYVFDFGGCQFFAMNVRTERYEGEHPTICSPEQIRHFKSWLLAHRDEVKFVVTSVPFVGQPRNSGDKWAGELFRPQRFDLVDFIAANGIRRLVFLTGDMHCSYHATMKVAAGGGEIVIHELMSSPISQLTESYHAFLPAFSGTTPGGATFNIELREDEFYGGPPKGHSNVMHVACSTGGQVSWNAYRTKDPNAAPVIGSAFDI